MTWHNLLAQRLGLDWLPLRPDAVPFSIQSLIPQAQVPHSAWSVDDFHETSPDRWELKAHTARGLEATWKVQFFPDTRAMECWGSVSNRGSEDLIHVNQTRALDVSFHLDSQVGLPWTRSINGVRFIPTAFPPHDFAVVDRQMLQQSQHHPLQVNSTADGWTSDEKLPVILLCDERQQRGFATFLEWSGMWHINLEMPCGVHHTPFPTDARLILQTGLSGIDINLQRGQTLPLPRVLFCAFDGDLDAGGNAVRRHIRRHVMPKLAGQEALPPTSFNHWFAFENDFTAESFKPAVEASVAAGLEYFCVDGGWFRGGFREGIGNWEDGDPQRFPQGIKPFSDYVRAQGIKYGTWFEPEWAHKDSDLYVAHPEWFWESPRVPNTWRREYHLMNFGLPEVREWWLQRFIRAYEEWGMRWVRWDYNSMPRPNWDHNLGSGEIGWRQIEHVTGLYQVLDDIREACPDLLVEQCASGGHRIELGMVRRGHSFWMNDHTTNTDIVRFMQHGLNTILPGNYPNTNLCQMRHDFTDYDFLSHGAGGFGYSGRLWEAPAQDFERFKNAITRYKGYRHILLGDFERSSGQSQRYDDYTKVVFRDDQEALALEFNLPDAKRSAKLTLG